MNPETIIKKNIMAAINRTGRARLFNNPQGFDSAQKITYGIGNGSPDLIGVLRSGRVFCVEVKTASGRLSADQTAWWKFAALWGITGGVARSVDDALALLNEAEK